MDNIIDYNAIIKVKQELDNKEIDKLIKKHYMSESHRMKTLMLWSSITRKNDLRALQTPFAYKNIILNNSVSVANEIHLNQLRSLNNEKS